MEVTIEQAIKSLSAYIDNEAYTDKFQNVCKLAIEALEKQIPKTAAYDELIKEWFCPCCGFPVSDIHEYGFSDSYCWHCGQAIEWGD